MKTLRTGVGGGFGKWREKKGTLSELEIAVVVDRRLPNGPTTVTSRPTARADGPSTNETR